MKYLAFLRSVLEPYIEGYWFVAMELAKMEGELPNGSLVTYCMFTCAFVTAESALLRQLHETLMNKVEQDLLVYGEYQLSTFLSDSISHA